MRSSSVPTFRLATLRIARIGQRKNEIETEPAVVCAYAHVPAVLTRDIIHAFDPEPVIILVLARFRKVVFDDYLTVIVIFYMHRKDVAHGPHVDRNAAFCADESG